MREETVELCMRTDVLGFAIRASGALGHSLPTNPPLDEGIHDRFMTLGEVTMCLSSMYLSERIV